MEKLDDVWGTRDFPTLLATARLLEDGERWVRASAIAEATELPREAVMRALNALVPGYLEGKPMDSMGGRLDWMIGDLTERGRRAVGLWPAGEGLDALVDTLRKAEDATDDPEEKKLLHRAAGALGAVSREVMADVLAAFVRQQAGL